MTTDSFNILITNDNIFEGNEDVIIEIVGSSLSNEVVVSDPNQATINIMDDDGETNFLVTYNSDLIPPKLISWKNALLQSILIKDPVLASVHNQITIYGNLWAFVMHEAKLIDYYIK